MAKPANDLLVAACYAMQRDLVSAQAGARLTVKPRTGERAKPVRRSSGASAGRRRRWCSPEAARV